MFTAFREFLTWLFGDAPQSAVALTYGVPRSGKWPPLERDVLRATPNCTVCGEKAECVHHVIPVHVDPSKELDRANLAAVCETCHGFVGHLRQHFKSYNKHFWADARTWREKIANRP
jgi:hypothetical protein